MLSRKRYTVRSVRPPATKKYMVTVDAEPDNYGTASGGGTYDAGEYAVVYATAGDGFAFVNWTENGEIVSTNAFYGFDVDRDRVLIANFEIKKYRVNLSVDGAGGTTTGEGLYNYNDLVTIEAIPNDGFDFVRWNKDSGQFLSFDSVYSFNIIADCNYIAKFIGIPIYLTLLVSPVGKGTATGAGSYITGDTVTVEANPIDGYQFVSWSENGEIVSTEAIYNFTIQSSKTLVANFEMAIVPVLLTTTINPIGTGSANGSGSYMSGDQVTVEAIANEGAKFISWTENGVVLSNDSTFSFIILNDMELVANFAAFENDMILEVQTSSDNEAVKLPIYYGGEVEGYNYAIEWGDGSAIEYFATKDAIHIYASAGAYDIKISGNCGGIDTNRVETNEFELQLIRIKQWGDVGSYRLCFINCVNLLSIPNGPITGGNQITTMAYLFANCGNLTIEIPGDIFSLLPNITSDALYSEGFYMAFSGCKKITGSIPENLFANNTLVGDQAFSYTFSNCEGLTGTIPENLFANNPLVGIGGFEATFYRCSGLTGTIPENLFKFNILNNSFSQTFESCSGLTGPIPENLFAYNPLVEYFVSTFRNCSKITGPIPANLFANNALVKSFAQVFLDCSLLSGSIPANLFANNILAETFQLAFQGTGITGLIPVELFKNNINTVGDAFQATFSQCSGLTGSIPEDLFRYNTQVSGLCFSTTFNACSGLTGAIPVNLFKFNTLAESFKATFNECTGISGIPQDLFRYNTQANDFSSVFNGCTGLTGTIPQDLFRYNILAKSFSNAFALCGNLNEAPNGLFKYNLLVESLSESDRGFCQTFYYCSKLRLNPYIFFDAGDEATFFLNRNISFFNLFNRPLVDNMPQGTAPELWNCNFGTGTIYSKRWCFGGLGNNINTITNYNDIPNDWK